MPTKPENFEKSESKYKLTLLQMEKRFVDLETNITELRDKIKEITPQPISPLQQRIDDLEDLIMVEQAGVLELKKMLEGTKEKLEQAPDISSIVSKSNERLDAIEKSILAIKEKIIPKTELEGSIRKLETELEDKIKKLEDDIVAVSVKSPPTSVEMETLHKNFDDLSSQLRSFSSRTESILKSLHEKIREIEAKPVIGPGVDFDLLSSKIESIKLSLDSMTKKRMEMDFKITEIEKKFEIIENRIRESVSEDIMDEIKSNKKDLMTANIRVDSLERVSRELISNLQNLENSIKKFESLERVTLLSKDIEDKIERFKFIEDDMKRLSSRVELIYDDIEKRIMNINNLERNVSKLNETISSMTKELNKNKVEISNKVSSEFVKNLDKKLEEQSKEFEDRAKAMNNLFTVMNEKINIVENEHRNLIQNMKKAEVKEKPEELQKLFESLKGYDSRMIEISNQLSNVQQKIPELENDIRQKFTELKAPTFLTEQVSELLNKLVFLESRLGAVESLMQKNKEFSRVQPVILE